MALTLENPIKETSSITNEKPPVGYKISEVGMIPEDWNVIQFSDLLDFRNGVNADKVAYGKGIPFINVLEVITYSHLSVAQVPGRITLSASITSMFDIRYGDILFNRTSETQEELGLASTYLSKSNEKIVFGGFVIRGRPKGNLIDAKYSGYAFRSPLIRSQITSRGQGAIRANIGQHDLSKIFIVIPSLKEQQTIAAALSDIDSLINSLDQLVAKKRNIKLAAMQQLLAGKQRLSGFKGELESKRLADLGEFRGGCGFPLKYQGEREGDYPFFKVSDMNNNGNEMFMTGSNNYISEQIRKNIGATIFPKNTIIFAKVGAAIFLERKRILAQMSCVDNNVMGFVLKEKTINLTYLYYLFLSFSFGKLVCTTALPSLNGKEIGNLLHDFPSLREQTAIANVLSDMDTELSSLEQQLDKARNLKQGMMQELLTGRIRLT